MHSVARYRHSEKGGVWPATVIQGREGTCAVHVNKRKNDRVPRGHHPALGHSEDPELDIVHQLRVWMEVLDWPYTLAAASGAHPQRGVPGALRSFQERGAGGAT